MLKSIFFLVLKYNVLMVKLLMVFFWGRLYSSYLVETL
jgi:hypothetical protein